MSAELRIVRYRPEHDEGIAELQTVLWSPDPLLNRRYLEWKYRRNPWAVEPRIYLALRGDRVVGMRGFYESRWEVGSRARPISIPLADDLVVHPSERNSGLATRLTRVALEDLAASGLEFALSLSAGFVTMLGLLTLGWKSTGRYDAVVRLDPRRRARIALRARLARTRLAWRWAGSPMLYSAAERFPFARLDTAQREAGHHSISRDSRPAAMAELIGSLGHDGRLRHVRSPEFLSWRFANPTHQYRFLYAGSHRLDGYLVLRSRVMASGPTPRVWIVDLEGRDAHTRSELLRTAVGAGRFAELAVWAATLEPQERALLNELGFEPDEPGRAARGWPCGLVGSTRGLAPSDWVIDSLPLLDPQSWDLRMLYSMAG